MADRYWVGGSGTWDTSSTANWSATSGGAAGASAPTAADAVIFDSGSGTGTVTTAVGATGLTAVINSTNINLTLGANLTIAGAVNLLIGTINLSSFTFFATTFTSFNTNIRTIAFGTGKFSLSGNAGFIWACNDTTNLTITGEPVVDLTYAGAVGTRNVINGSAAGGSEAIAISVNITAGSDIIQLDRSGTPGTSFIKNLNFTGFTGTGPTTFGFALYGNLTLGAGMTVGDAGFTFSGTSGIQTITSNGVTCNCAFTKNGAGTLQLQDNLTMGSTRTFTLTAGTLDLVDKTLSTGLFVASNSNVRYIAFGTGNITVTGNAGTVWSTSTATNLTVTGTPVVNATYAGATGTRVFSIGNAGVDNLISLNVSAGTDTVSVGLSTGSIKDLNFTGFNGTLSTSTRRLFGNLTFSAGMTVAGGSTTTTFAGTSGTQQITTNGVVLDIPLTFDGIGGTFAFQDALTQGSTRNFTIANGTVQLKNGVTSTVGNFVANNSNVKFLQSTTPGSQATLSQASGTVNVVDLTIRDINAVGGASWNAYTDFENTDAGNNDGWNFNLSPPYSTAELPVTLRPFTQPRRF